MTSRAVADAAAYATSWLAFRRQHLRVPGVQASIWHDGVAIATTASGVADLRSGEALRADHRFRFASHSKTMTATVLGQLHDEGVLQLDDRLDRWLAWTAEIPVGEVSLAELAAHGAGLSRDTDHADHWALMAPFLDAEALATRVAADVLRTGEEVDFKYSNVGYSLLGQVIEAATGATWAHAVTERIVTPLGLIDTGPDWTPGVERMATGHTGLSWADRRVPVEQVPTAAMAAATGIWSTTDDMCAYLSAHLPGDGRLTSDRTGRRLQRVHRATGQDGLSYGLGFMIAEVAGRTLFGHGGGWPGMLTRSHADAGRRLVVSVAANAIDAPVGELADGVVKLLDLAFDADRPLDGPPPGDAPGGPGPGWDAAGRYTTLWGVRDLVHLGGRWLLIDPASADPIGAMVQLGPVDGEADQMLMVRGQGFGSIGERVKVERDAQGTVSALWMGGTRSVPIERATLPDVVSPTW